MKILVYVYVVVCVCPDFLQFRLHSGTYMIKQVNHQFNMTDGRKLDTVLDLVRDSQGIKDQESIVK